MQARAATWADVRVGSYIQDLTGSVWKVINRKEGFWGLQNRAGEKKILTAPPADKTVKVMYLTQGEIEAKLVEDLGAEVHSWKLEGQRVLTCKPFNGLRIDMMRSHLWLMHGVPSTSVNLPGQPAGMNSKKALIECHDHKHANPHPERWTPHVHEDQMKESW